MSALAPLSVMSIAGCTFKASDRTQQHILATIARLAVKHPGARLEIIQGCYHEGVVASAGTHDKDACIDCQIIGMPGATDEDRWWAAQRVLRECGWAAWFRHTGSWAARDAWHIHMVSIPPGLPADPTAGQVQAAFEAIGLVVGEFVPGQVDDYYAHAIGFKGQHRAGLDHSWFPSNINATVFEEDDMPTPKEIEAATKAGTLAALKEFFRSDPNDPLPDVGAARVKSPDGKTVTTLARALGVTNK